MKNKAKRMDDTIRILEGIKATIQKNPKEKRMVYILVVVIVICLFLIFYLIWEISLLASIITTVLLWAIFNIGSIFLFAWWGSKNPKALTPIADKIEKEAEISQDSFLIFNTSEDIFTKKPLPFTLKQLVIEKFQTIERLEIKDIPLDTQWIFLTGENGFGKTSILRAIAIGFVGRKDGSEIIIEDYDSKIGMELNYYSNPTILHLWNKKIDSNKTFPVAFYGPSRLQIQTDQTQNDVVKKSTTTYSLFNSDGVLLNIEFELLIWSLEKNPKFNLVKQIFLTLIPYLSDIEVDTKNRIIFYIEKEPIEDGVKYNPVTFNELASGFRSILAMVGDMMIRLFKSQPDITEPSELAGIVIIDEIDLHWHPKMQREIPALLSSIFPKVQFIVSTHSLVPLLGAPENSVLLKVNRTVEEGITVEKMDIDFQALSSDVMLRDIFDLEKYQSDAKQKAWERYTKLKGLIHFEKDEIKKRELIHEREILGDKYNFTL